MNNQWNASIDKLMIMSSNSWTKYDPKSSGKATLRIVYDQLMLISDTKVLESFNMNSKIKGIYKGDVLILIISMAGQQIRKLRFQLKTDIAHSLSRLGERFPVMSHNSLQSKNTITTKYCQIEEHFNRVLNDSNGSAVSVPQLSNYGEFIKLCLLDPAFPQIVLETEKLLKENLIK